MHSKTICETSVAFQSLGNVSLKDFSHCRWTCAHLASFLGRRDLVETLITHGADPSVKATNDVNCIYIAAQNGFPTTVQSQISLG